MHTLDMCLYVCVCVYMVCVIMQNAFLSKKYLKATALGCIASNTPVINNFLLSTYCVPGITLKTVSSFFFRVDVESL